MHLRDVLDEEINDFEDERLRIENLFQEAKFYSMYSPWTPVSLKQYLAAAFMDSKMRRTFISIDDFFGKCSKGWKRPSAEGLLFYCEVMLNVLGLMDEANSQPGDPEKLKQTILENIGVILKKMGYTSRRFSDGLIYVLKNDAAASAVVEDLPDSAKDIANAVLMYNRLESKGDVVEKGKLLYMIGRYVEPILQQYKTFLGLKYEIADNVRFGLNNLHIRHNNQKGKSAKPALSRMSKEALEEAYDDLYRSMLLLIELDKYPETDKRIKALRAKV